MTVQELMAFATARGTLLLRLLLLEDIDLSREVSFQDVRESRSQPPIKVNENAGILRFSIVFSGGSNNSIPNFDFSIFIFRDSENGECEFDHPPYTRPICCRIRGTA